MKNGLRLGTSRLFLHLSNCTNDLQRLYPMTLMKRANSLPYTIYEAS